MPDCPSLIKCPFFHDHMETKPAMAELMKKSYCQGDNSHCARWMVATTVGKEAVPGNLFPNQVDRAKDILRQHKK